MRNASSPAPASLRCRGFTLLEVLIAFTILTMALGALFEVFGGGLRSVGLSERYSRAALVAESRLASLGVESGLRVGELGGAVDDILHWRAVVEPYAAPDAVDYARLPVAPLLITVEVFWDEGARRRSVSLSSLKLAVRP